MKKKSLDFQNKELVNKHTDDSLLFLSKENSWPVLTVDKKLKEGLSEQQIYSYLKEKYGEWILYDPGLNKNTYILWLLPIFLFIISGLIIFKLFIIKKN